MKNQHKCIQLSILNCLSLIVKVLILTTKRKRNCCWWRANIQSKFNNSPLVFDLVTNKYYFPPVKDPKTFGTLDYDALLNTMREYSINRVIKFRTNKELKTLHHICAQEWTQLLAILAKSVQNPQLADYLSKGNRSTFLYVEGATDWLYGYS